jgi:hypothetical protein
VSVKTTTTLSDGRVMTRESSVYRGDIVEARLMNDTDVSVIVTLDRDGRAEVILVEGGEERRLESQSK